VGTVEGCLLHEQKTHFVWHMFAICNLKTVHQHQSALSKTSCLVQHLIELSQNSSFHKQALKKMPSKNDQKLKHSRPFQAPAAPNRDPAARSAAHPPASAGAAQRPPHPPPWRARFTGRTELVERRCGKGGGRTVAYIYIRIYWYILYVYIGIYFCLFECYYMAILVSVLVEEKDRKLPQVDRLIATFLGSDHLGMEAPKPKNFPVENRFKK